MIHPDVREQHHIENLIWMARHKKLQFDEIIRQLKEFKLTEKQKKELIEILTK